MSAMWECQKAIYTALSSDTTFMTKIGSRLYDEPPTNEAFPYVIIGQMTEGRFNKLGSKGFEVQARIDIYTKSGRLGFKPSKEIQVEVDRLLNLKRFNLTGFNMVQCYLETTDTERDEDKRIITSRYNILVESVESIGLFPNVFIFPSLSLYPTFEN
jgi:hypothetical protein